MKSSEIFTFLEFEYYILAAMKSEVDKGLSSVV